MHVDLGEDQWAELREPGELRRADKMAVLEHVDLEISPDERRVFVNGAADDKQVDALLERVITNWSLPFPLPKDDPASMGKLTLDQGDRLAEAVKPYMQLILGKVDPGQRGTDPTAG